MVRHVPKDVELADLDIAGKPRLGRRLRCVNVESVKLCRVWYTPGYIQEPSPGERGTTVLAMCGFSPLLVFNPQAGLPGASSDIGNPKILSRGVNAGVD